MTPWRRDATSAKVDGERRIYFTQAASVVSFFTDDGEGGVRPHVSAGEFACPWTTTREKLDAVEAAMLEETARRLNIRPDQVGGRGSTSPVPVLK